MVKPKKTLSSHVIPKQQNRGNIHFCRMLIADFLTKPNIYKSNGREPKSDESDIWIQQQIKP